MTLEKFRALARFKPPINNGPRQGEDSKVGSRYNSMGLYANAFSCVRPYFPSSIAIDLNSTTCGSRAISWFSNWNKDSTHQNSRLAASPYLSFMQQDPVHLSIVGPFIPRWFMLKSLSRPLECTKPAQRVAGSNRWIRVLEDDRS